MTNRPEESATGEADRDNASLGLSGSRVKIGSEDAPCSRRAPEEPESLTKTGSMKEDAGSQV